MRYPKLDPSIRWQMEDYGWYLDDMAVFYKQATIAIAEDAIIRDWRRSHQSPRAQRFARIRHVFARFAAFVRQQRPSRRPERASHARAMAIIARHAAIIANFQNYTADPAMTEFTVTIITPTPTDILALPEHYQVENRKELSP